MAIIGIKLYVVLIVAGLYLIAIIYYLFRKRWLKKKGFNLNEICQRIPEETKEVL
jgi:hypothetical protein